MNKERLFDVISMVVGIAIIIVGIIVVSTPTISVYTDSVDYAAFGADYYTEQYAATRAAVTNTAITANVLQRIEGKLAVYFGISFIITGVMIVITHVRDFFCKYSTKAVSASIKENEEEAIEQVEDTSES